MDDKTIDMVVNELHWKAIRLYCTYRDASESEWARDEAYHLWQGYKDAAAIVSNLNEGK